MSKMSSTRFTYSPAMSSSLRPSGVPDIDLPFGPPSPELGEIRSKKARIAKDLHRRIRALANNANRIRRRSPLVAAKCWHESGRLLERHAGRLMEAWVCYSRAVALFPDHKPSITALRRLARIVSDNDVLEQLIAAQCERPVHPSEKAALLSELAALKMRQGEFGQALRKLHVAAEIWPKAMVPRLLMIFASYGTADRDTQVASVQWLIDELGESEIGRALRLEVARIEEERGDLKRAYEILDVPATRQEVDIPLRWARFLLSIKLERPEVGRQLLVALEKDLGGRAPVSVLRRIHSAVTFVNGGSKEGAAREERERETQDVDPLHELIRSFRTGDKVGSIDALQTLIRLAHTNPLKEALAISQMLEAWEPDKKPEITLGQLDVSSAACKATLSFLKMGSREEARAPEIPAAALQRALDGGNWKRTAQILKGLRLQTTDRDARWPLCVAEAGVRIEHLEQTEEAMAALLEEDRGSNRRPLPALLRRFEKKTRKLSRLAADEAKSAKDKSFKATRLAWAAYHMESTDPFEAARLYTESLVVDPSLLFSIAGLHRTAGTSGEELVTLYLTAAETARDGAARVRAVLRAAVEQLVTGQIESARALLARAAELSPNDGSLQRIALRYALSAGDGEQHRFMKLLLGGNVEVTSSPTLLGQATLFRDPLVAAEWFEKALDENPSDRIAARGLTEALMLGGRASLLSERLLAELRNADNQEMQAGIYLRVAHIDRFLREDTSSATLSLLSLDELLPGHRSTLARLAIYFLARNRKEDMRRALSDLVTTVDDETDALALLRFDALGSLHRKDILHSIVANRWAGLLELTEYEGVCKDRELRVALLERIREALGASMTYLSRMAEEYGEMGRHDEAVSLFKKSAESELCAIYAHQALLPHLEAIGDFQTLVETLLSLAKCWSEENHKVNSILEAAEIAREKMGEPLKGAKLCLGVLALYPHNHRAYLLGREMLGSCDDVDALWRELFEARLQGSVRPLEKFELHLRLRDLMTRLGDEDSRQIAEVHLQEAIAVVSARTRDEDIPPDSLISPEDFDTEIERLAIKARIDSEPADEVALFTALAEVYFKSGANDRVARKYYRKVLQYDEANVQALSRLFELNKREGDMEAASDLLDHLSDAIGDPKQKVEAMVERAQLLLDHFKDGKGAEQLLLDAHRVDPLAMGPIKLLAEMYLKQNDTIALNIHLNGALTGFASGIEKRPDDVALLEGVKEVLFLKGERVLGAIAEDVVSLIQGKSPDRPLASWKANRQIGDPVNDDYLCPEAATVGLRECLKVIEMPLARHFSVTADQRSNAKLVKLKKRDKLAAAVHRLAPWFGFKDLVVWVGGETKLRLLPGTPPYIIFPEAVHRSASAGVYRFAAACALQLLRMHLAIVTTVDPRELRDLLLGLARFLNSDFECEALGQEGLEEAEGEIKKMVPATELARLAPSAHGLAAALAHENIMAQLKHVGHRSGLLAAGSAADALEGIRLIESIPLGPLASIPGAGLMMGFAVSRDHIELRQRFKSK